MTSRAASCVVCREPSPSQELVVLGRRYLYFLAQAQALGGKVRNHLGYDRRWHDAPGTEDGWGYSLLALGTAAARGPTADIREEAVHPVLPRREGLLILGRRHGIRGARRGRGTRHAARPPRRTRAALPGQRHHRRSSRRPRVAVADAPAQPGQRGHRRGRHRVRPPSQDNRMLQNGLRMLEWLLATETRDGHLSVVSPKGWGLGEFRPASDQRPAEVAALADACMRAAAVTGDSKWLAGVEMSVAWLLGDNDAKVPLLDERTGGCSDGITSAGRSRNQGAESTLAMIAVLQQGHRMTATRAPTSTTTAPM